MAGIATLYLKSAINRLPTYASVTHASVVQYISELSSASAYR